jgi:hypothetical protein
MIAVRFSATGVPEQVGVWAKNGDLAEPGVILSVDGFAKQFTDWSDGAKTDAELRQSDDGVSEARDCAEES